jgi:hypothetical protein
MKRIRFLIAASSALAISLAVNAGAQDTTRAAAGDVARAPTFASMITAINASAGSVEKIKARTAIQETELRLVDAGELLASGNEADFNSAIEKNTSTLDSLRAALQANETVVKVLTNHPAKLTAADIVGADILADGQVVVFYRKKQ